MPDRDLQAPSGFAGTAEFEQAQVLEGELEVVDAGCRGISHAGRRPRQPPGMGPSGRATTPTASHATRCGGEGHEPEQVRHAQRTPRDAVPSEACRCPLRRGGGGGCGDDVRRGLRLPDGHALLERTHERASAARHCRTFQRTFGRGGSSAPRGVGETRCRRHEGTVDTFLRAVQRHRVDRFERLQHGRRVLVSELDQAAQVLTAKDAFLGDDRQERRIEVRRELSEGVVLRDDLGQRTEAEPHHARFEHRCRECRGTFERDPVGGVPRRSPQLAAGLLGGCEAGVAQCHDLVPPFARREPVGLAHEAIEVTECEEVPQSAQDGAVSTRSMMKTSVSPGPITSPAPRSP
jgi:hypothetical protein